MNTILISAGIILVGFLIGLFLIFRARRKAKAIIHYEAIRDKLTLREEEEKVEDSLEGSFGLGNIVGGFVALFVGLSLLPVISKEIKIACGESASSVANVTQEGLAQVGAGLCEGTAGTILGIMPIFFAIGVLIIGLGMMRGALRNTGML